MTKEVWLNMPVKDINRSKEFFSKLGFSFTQHGNSEHTAGLQIGARNFVIMLFAESMFEAITRSKATDTNQSSEMMISIDAESREEVDELAKKAADAGGMVFGKPGESQGWMYGCGFTDLDGHRWNVLYMDMSKMPKA